MREIKLYTKGTQSFIKPVNSEWFTQDIRSDGFNVHFGENSEDLRGAEVFTIVTTTECNESAQDEAVYFSIDDQKNVLRAENPLICGGEYFRFRKDFFDRRGFIVGNIKDWKTPIGKIMLDIDGEVEPWKLYFCIVNLRPFYCHPGIIGVIYGDFDESQKERLLAGEFYDPAAVLKSFPQAKVANIEYDLDVEKWNYEICGGIVHNNEAEFSFQRMTDIVNVDFDEYEKAMHEETEGPI